MADPFPYRRDISVRQVRVRPMPPDRLSGNWDTAGLPAQVNSEAASAGRTAVDTISFRVDGPALVGVIGRSGAGKFPVLRMMNRLTDASAGRILVERRDILALPGPTRRQWQGAAIARAPVLIQVLDGGLARFEINLRASAIPGFVGSGGIGHDLKIAVQRGQGRHDKEVAICLLLFIAIDRLSRPRTRLAKGRPA